MVPADLHPGLGTVLRLRPRLEHIAWMDAATGAALETRTR